MATLTTFAKANNSANLILDKQRSVILPEFDASSIVESRISRIVLSLFLLDFSLPGNRSRINLTVNPFNPETREINDGLSIVIKPKKGYYIDFKLPRELFEKIIGSKKRLLLRVVNSKVRLIFQGPANTVNDPRLLVIYSDGSTSRESPPIIDKGYTFIQINNGSGDNVAGDKTTVENPSNYINMMKDFFLPVLVLIAGTLFLYYIFGVGK